MGRGTSDTAGNVETPSTRGAIKLTRAAIDNWSRFTHASEDLATARREMIKTIHRSGRIEPKPPAWMTSAPAHIAAYCNLPGDVTLLLVGIDDNQFTWQAGNCVAPKGVRRKARSTGVRRVELTGADLEEALELSGEDLSGRIRLSKHALEQVEARGGCSVSGGAGEKKLHTAIAANGRVVPNLPDWANPNKSSTPALLVEVDGDLLAMPLAPPSKEPDGVSRYVAATSISRRWAGEVLPELHTHRLRQTVHVSSGAARMRAREMGGELENQRSYLNSLMTGELRIVWNQGRPEVVLSNGEHLLLNAADADQRASTGKTWVAHGWRPADASGAPA